MMSMRHLQALFLFFYGALPKTAADGVTQKSPALGASDELPVSPPLTEVGLLCENTIKLAVPADENPKIVTGAHAKLISFLDCSFHDTRSVPATVYQIEGTGAMLDVFLFRDEFGSSEVAVFEGCPSRARNNSTGATNNGSGGSIKFANCVVGQYPQGARWQTKVGQLYTIVVYSYASLSSTAFILQIEVVEANPVCGTDGISPIHLDALNTNSSVQILGGSEDSVKVTDLPPCDYQTRSTSVLYKITVDLQPNVVFSVFVEGNDAVVTVYQGNCETGYSCLPLSDVIINDTAIGYKSSKMIMENKYGKKEGTSTFSVESQVRQGGIAMPRVTYNVQSFHHGKAGAIYLIAVSSCCGVKIGDFRLTLKGTSYGNVCEDSVEIDLSAGESSVTVDLSEAKVYRNLYSCHTRGDYDVNGYQSSSVDGTALITSPVASYKITGDGNTYIAYIAPPHIGQIRTTLFKTNFCDRKPHCLQGDNFSNLLLIETRVNETYYLAVYSEQTEDNGSYNLTISPVSKSTPCEDAINLKSVGDGITVNGTLEGTALYNKLSMCNVYGELSRFRVYAFVAEKDGPMLVTAKVDPNLNFYPSLTVVTSCVSGECIAGLSNFEVEVMQPAVVWYAELGVTYYIAVSRIDYIAYNGDFQLTMEPLTMTTICDYENVVDMGTVPDEGATFDGSTISGPLFTVPTSCQEEGAPISPTSRAATFTLQGDGNAYMLSVSDASGINPQATVFQGSCDNFVCIPTDVYADSFLVGTEMGETYTIVVGDCCIAVNLGGTFKLHAKKIIAGNLTADAKTLDVPVSTETQRVLGSTSLGRLYPGLPLCQFSVDSPASIYKIDTGVGLFSAQVTGFGFDAQLSLFKEDAIRGLDCYGTHGHRDVSWEVTKTQNLYLVVYGCCGMSAAGDFSLQLSKLNISGNPCDDANDLGNVPDDGLRYVGTLSDLSLAATVGFENESICDYGGQHTFPPMRSKLFIVYGNGKTLKASALVSHTTSNQISLTVVKSFCGSVECIEGAYSTIDPFESITWPSVAGETYDIVVSTSLMETDDEFLLMVYEEGLELFGSNSSKGTNHGVNNLNSSSNKLVKCMWMMTAVVMGAMFCCY
ncbi:hypothetical protein FisN_26Lh043 [Fistulifera solaris]|uniref:Uncharacterized protein n=1 Tax=Fistulifera solaris TaxID=1519565 RepID=A0A1Z5KCW2_FISSO|nr:hypothetical protein FisN_26Lh043 [Fistulifera solaris]|eukprot:GAX23985.1 hypothetical protein FisN_26Lh043 [Fistulifera solaris]